MPEAMKRVKAELGPNAVILHSRETGGGWLGLFGSRGVEVTAAVDDAPKKPAAQPAMPQAPRPKSGGSIDIRVGDDDAPPKAAAPQPAPDGDDNPLLALAKKLQEVQKDVADAPSQAQPPKTSTPGQPPAVYQRPEPPVNKPNELEKRLGSLEDQLMKLTGMIEKLSPLNTACDPSPVPARTRELYNHLLEQDVDESLALNLAVQIAESADESDDVWTLLKARLASKLRTAEPLALDFEAKRPRIIMLVGSTGVGKTTTLAKISALYRYDAKAKQRPKIAFITADLYRLAAVEQLQKYTEILGAELEVTYSAEEVKQAIQKHKDANLILFDTAGASQRNLPQMNTLSGIVEACNPDEVHLVLSSTTKYSDMVDVVEHFSAVKPRRVIFTKIDESTTYGSLLNTMVKYDIPISYITTGQNVPEDIEAAKPERIAKLLLTKPTVNRSIQWKDGSDDAAPAPVSEPQKPAATATPAKKDAPETASAQQARSKGNDKKQGQKNEKPNS
ncbi:MAG: flagellar biosynthesis protein FlhF [bacterium]|nr:flagellar biosynthesis protein FlhF [bacterium]